jgi:hypothetical protein
MAAVFLSSMKILVYLAFFSRSRRSFSAFDLSDLSF